MKKFHFYLITLAVWTVSCSDEQTSFTTARSQVEQPHGKEGLPSSSDASAQSGNATTEEGQEGIYGQLDPNANKKNEAKDIPSTNEPLNRVDDYVAEPTTEDIFDESTIATEEPEVEEPVVEEPVVEEPVLEDDSKELEEKVEEVQKLCNNAAGVASMKEFVKQVRFEEVNDCTWGLDGNEPRDKVNDRFQVARVDQQFDLDFALKAGTQICSMDMNMPEQDMLFDDHMLLTLNDFVVASSVDFTLPFLKEKALPVVDGLTVYSWEKFKGMPFYKIFDGTKPYCVGIDNSVLDNATYKSLCDIPVTQKFGKMTVDIPEATATKMAIKIKDSQKDEGLRLNLITTGDDDEEDCRHKAFNFQVIIRYLD